MVTNASGGDADVREAVRVWRQGGNILDFLLRFCYEPKTAFFFLMQTIFKVFTEFVTVILLLLFFFFLCFSVFGCVAYGIFTP